MEEQVFSIENDTQERRRPAVFPFILLVLMIINVSATVGTLLS